MVRRLEKILGKFSKGIITAGLAASLFLGCSEEDKIIDNPPPSTKKNNPPVIFSAPPTTVSENQNYNYQVQASDADKDGLSYALIKKPNWISISNSGLISGIAPEVSSDEFHDLELSVSDGKNPVSQKYTLAVKNLFNTHVLTANQIGKLISVDSTALYFSQAMNFSPGDVISSGISTQTPAGLLREITSISSDKKIIYTSQATLEQIVRNASLSYSGKLLPSSLKSSHSLEGISMFNASAQNLDFSINLNNVVLYDRDQNPNTKTDQLIVNGNISFNTNTIFNLDVKDYRLTNLTFRNLTDINSDITAGFNVLGIAQMYQIKVAEYKFQPFVVGYLPTPIPVPVIILPKLGVYIGIDPTNLNPLSVRVQQNTSLDMGLFYNGIWTSSSTFSKEFNFSNPIVNGDLELKLHAGPQLELMLYGVAGPFAGISGRLRLKAKDGGWELYGGWGASLGVKMQVLKKKASLQFKEIVNYEKLLAIGNPPPPTTLAIQPGPEGKDAYVQKTEWSGGTYTYSGDGSSAFLNIGNFSNLSKIAYESLIQFPLSSIPSNSKITSAKLRLYGQGAYSGETAKVRVNKIIGPWEESTVKWNNKPLYGDYISNSDLTDKLTWFEWDVSSLVQQWINGATNYGLVLSTDVDRPRDSFKSSDYLNDISLRPMLLVSYY